VVGVAVGVNAEVIAGLHAVELAAAPIDGANVQPRGVAAALWILRTGRVTRAAAVGPDAPIAALSHAARARAGTRLGVELLTAGALHARALALAGALVALVPLWTWLFRTVRFLFLFLFLRFGQCALRSAGEETEDAASQQAHHAAARVAITQSANHIIEALLVHLVLPLASRRSTVPRRATSLKIA
jgi:hypothetical protein